MSPPRSLAVLALLAALAAAGCDKRSDTSGAAPETAPMMPPASAASR